MLHRKKSKEQPARQVQEPRQAAPVFSYYSNRNRTNSPVGREKPNTPRAENKHRLAFQLPVILTIAVIVSSLAYLSTLTASPKIVPFVESTPNLLQETSVYEAAAADILDNTILNRSKLTINTDKVASELKQRFAELHEVTVIMPLAGRRPIIEIQPAEPSLIIAAESGVFILNHEGRSVMDARKAPADLVKDIPVLTDETAAPVELGKLALTRDMVSYIDIISKQLSAANIQLESLTLPPIPHELHLRVTGEGYYVKLYTLGDARLQSGAFLAVRDELTKNNQPKEYIDVRLEDKVFFR